MEKHLKVSVQIRKEEIAREHEYRFMDSTTPPQSPYPFLQEVARDFENLGSTPRERGKRIAKQNRDRMKKKIKDFERTVVFDERSGKPLSRKAYMMELHKELCIPQQTYRLQNTPNMSRSLKRNIAEVLKQVEPTESFEAQELPKYVSINHVIFEVSNYIQKVILCHNCMRYGHLGKQCKGKPRCAKCHGEHPSSTCQSIDNDPECLHCKGNHYNYEMGKCNEFQRQKNIKKHMANTNSSYKDAEKAITKLTYAHITKTNSYSTTQPNTQLLSNGIDSFHFNSIPSTSRQTMNSQNSFIQTVNNRDTITRRNTTLFRIGQINTRSILAGFNEFSTLVYQNNFDIIGVTET
nr:unnamed protein product [Callosobruchus chinensis]